jgi:hypothetical protein
MRISPNEYSSRQFVLSLNSVWLQYRPVKKYLFET